MQDMAMPPHTSILLYNGVRFIMLLLICHTASSSSEPTANPDKTFIVAEMNDNTCKLVRLPLREVAQMMVMITLIEVKSIDPQPQT